LRHLRRCSGAGLSLARLTAEQPHEFLPTRFPAQRPVRFDPDFFNCVGCHGSSAIIYPQWTGSLMAQAARDPVFYACLDIAEADALGSGDICIRCHSPKAWMEGRSSPTNGSAITAQDRDGVTCNFCHRMVDPYNLDGQAPAVDADILSDLGADAPV